MFRQEDWRELAAYRAETPILSIYLDVDPTVHTKDEYRLALRQLIKRIEEAANPEDVRAVKRYFDHEYDWSGRGVAIFSCAKGGFWRAYTLAVPVASGATVARKPYVSPLAGLMDAYGSYMVAQVDQQGVRLSLFEMGELRASDGHVGEDVRKLKKGRGSSGGPGRRGGAPISGRHEKEVIQRNIRDNVEATQRFWRRHKPQRLVIAGAEPTVRLFCEELPKALQEQVIGTFSADLTAPELEIRDRSLEILQLVEEGRKRSLVGAVFTAAAKGRGGVIRLADTLGAAHEGRIQTLVVARGYHEKGYQCQNCSFITDHALEKCPFCEGAFAEISDATEALVMKVMEDGGKVEVVADDPKIAEFGVGALLRY